MQTMHLIAGTPEWHTHRAQHFNASDAPAMLGCSPYTTRAGLLRRLHTGLTPEVDAGTQRIFDNGHRFEALARSLAEEIIGDDLAPVIGTEGRLSASFDGLTLMGDTAWEHKTLNSDLRACMKDQGNGYSLPKHYQVQMEQQLLVSGAERVLFMASEWTGDGVLVEERHCWYASDPALRAEIIAGWKQFAEDLAVYVPPAASAVEKIVAEPVEALPAVSVQVEGTIVIQENFDAFERAMRDFLEHRLIREPKTDQDFADLDVQIKAMKGAEAALEAAEAGWIAQIEPVSTAKRRKDMLRALVRDNRLMAEKLLASEKEHRRGEIVAAGIGALREHVEALNKRLGKPYMPATATAVDFGSAIKSLRSLASMEDAVATRLASAKIAANETADRIQANLATLREQAAQVPHLFPDTAAIVLKAPDDLQALVTARIAEHRQAEERRLEAERARIRAEEEAKAQAKVRAEQEAREAEERRQRAAAEEAQRQEAAALERGQRDEAGAEARRQEQEAMRQQSMAGLGAAHPQQPAAGPAVIPMPTRAPAAPAGPPTLRLGQINERLGFTVSADFLARLGYPLAGTEKAAKLWHESSWHGICAAIAQHVVAVANGQKAA